MYYQDGENPDQDGVGLSATITNMTIENYPCWFPGGQIQCSGITAPSEGTLVNVEQEVTCTAASATDLDLCKYSPTFSQNIADSFNNWDAYTWACSAGAFKDGDNTGQSVPGSPPPRRRRT
jgi:hypothetical protein